MSAWHVGQGLLACGVLAYCWRHAQRILVDARCDAKAFMLAACELHARALHTELGTIARACQPAWLARVCLAAISPDAPEGPEDLIERLRVELRSSVGALSSLGRLSMALGFLAILLQLAGALSGGHGLLALQRGLVERMALERSALSLALATGTAAVCYAAAHLFRSRGTSVLGEAQSALRTFKDTLR